MNTAKCHATSFTPAYLTFGRELTTHDDVHNNQRSVVLSENFIPGNTPKLLRLADTLAKAREVAERSQQHNNWIKTNTNTKLQRRGPSFGQDFCIK